jgi:hypothetical protein
MKALILNNKVVDIAEAEFPVSPEMTWMDAPVGCQYGWLLEGDSLIAPPADPESTYAEKRKREYRELNQLEMQYDDQVNGTTTWVDAIDAIKAKYPKPE